MQDGMRDSKPGVGAKNTTRVWCECPAALWMLRYVRDIEEAREITRRHPR